MKLRNYQQEAVDAVFAFWDRAPSTPEKPASPLVVMPTGSGKSLVLAETTRRLVQDYGASVLVATHRAELITQDVRAIRSVWPMAPVSIYSASLKRKELGTPVVVAGVQSIARVASRLPHVDVCIIDEAHLVPPTASEQYGRLLGALRDKNPDVRLIGYTATPYRLGQGMLTQGAGALFSAVAYDVPIRRLIDEGYLAPVITGAPTTAIDVSGVSVVAGEYNLGEMAKASDTDRINAAVARDIKAALDSGRTSGIVFAVDVAHAARLRNELQLLGVSAETIVGDTPRERRDEIIARFKARKLQVITSCDVLTTGFDAPVVDVVAMVRATLSPSLYVQVVGRGTRIADGKVDCLLLDYGANIARHGPIDAVNVKPKRPGKGPAPMKTCETCWGEAFAGCRECPWCGAPFPEPEKTKVEEKASDMQALSWLQEQEKPRKVPVGGVTWSRHVKMGGGTPTLRLDYYAPGASEYDRKSRVASEWVCVEHEEGGFAHKKAMWWWDANVGCRRPTSVDDAITLLDAGYMAKVVQVTLKKDGQYDRVIKVLQVEGEKESWKEHEIGDDVAPETPTLEQTFFDDDLPF